MKAAGVAALETDLDEPGCCFDLAADIDVEEFLNRLAEKNSKMKDWSFADPTVDQSP